MTKFLRNIICCFVLFLLSSVTVFAEENLNTLSDITVTGNGINFTITLGFKDKFGDSAFLQKQDDGYYHIFIPDAVYDRKNLKINYKLSKKVYKPQFDIEQRRYIKNNADSKYIRLDVYTDDDAVLSIVTENSKSKIISRILKFSLIFFLLSVGIAALYLFRNVIPGILTGKNYNTFVPESFSDDTSKGYKTYKRNFKETELTVKESLFDSVLTSGMADFPSFAINDKVNIKDKKVSVESTLSKAKELSFSENQTNPLLMNINSDLSEFSSEAEEEAQIDNNENEKDEILSILNVTPTKGFVLKRVNGKYLLLSFNGASQRVLKSFLTLSDFNLRARFFDRSKQNDIYIVKVGEYKSMVEFSEKDVKELMVL